MRARIRHAQGVPRMRPPSIPQLVARLADRALAPADAVRNAAAAAFELSQHTAAWREGLAGTFTLEEQRVVAAPGGHPSQG